QPQPEVSSEVEGQETGSSSPEDLRSRRQRPKAWAHNAVRDSYAEAKLRGSTWNGWGFRIAPHVKSRLMERIKADRRSLGRGDLAIGHYVDAALRHIPVDVDDQVAMAEAFGLEQLWNPDKDRSKPSTYRVGPEAYELMSNLNMVLQEADKGRRGVLVVSAGLERLLDALEAEGALTLPKPRKPAR
ncbi:hypothetical protein ACIQU4_28440, partial [Streptomyces sp. NPDC090741]